MSDQGAIENCRGIFAFITFQRDPQLKGVVDGTDEFISVADLARTLSEIGDPDSALLLPFAARLAIQRICPDASQTQRNLTYEGVLRGDNLTLRIQRQDIVKALAVAHRLRGTEVLQDTRTAAQRETA